MLRKFFRFLTPDDGSGSGGGGGSTPPAAGEDVTGLRNTVAALRQELSQANSALRQFEGIDPAAARQALARVPDLESQAQTLTNQLNMGRIDNAVNNLTAGVLPQYRDLLSSNVRGLLQTNDQGQVVSTDSRSLEAIAADFRTRYPSMFVAESIPAGSGTVPSAGSASPPPASVVDAPHGIIQGVDPDAIIKGEVTINPV